MEKYIKLTIVMRYRTQWSYELRQPINCNNYILIWITNILFLIISVTILTIIVNIVVNIIVNINMYLRARYIFQLFWLYSCCLLKTIKHLKVTKLLTVHYFFYTLICIISLGKDFIYKSLKVKLWWSLFKRPTTLNYLVSLYY